MDLDTLSASDSIAYQLDLMATESMTQINLKGRQTDYARPKTDWLDRAIKTGLTKLAAERL